MRHLAISLILILSTMLAFADDPPAEVPPGEIAGIVTNQDGQPIEGALVDAMTYYPHKTTTDNAGRFHLKGLDKQRRNQLRISKEGFSPWYELNQSAGIGDLKVALNNKTYFEGTVTSPDGKPVPNALVRADSGPKVTDDQLHLPHVWTETTSDAEGHYKLFVAPDSYMLQVRVPDSGIARARAIVNADQALAQDIHLEPGIRFLVNCVDGDTGAAVAGAVLNVYRQKGMRATTDANGQAVFEHMPADRFEFEVTAKTYVKWWSADAANERLRERPQNLSLRWENIEFDVTPDAKPATIQLEKGITIAGQVIDPDGKPVADATIATAKFGWADSIDSTKQFTARTDAQGAFSIMLPASGDDQFCLIAHDGEYGKWRKWANGVTDPMQTKPGENKDDVTIKLTTPATIKGQVVDKAGNPVPDKWVRVMSIDERDSRYTAPDTHSDKEGNFELKFVRPGDVLVQAEPFIMKNEFGRTPPIIGVSVTVAENEVKEDVKLTIPK